MALLEVRSPSAGVVVTPKLKEKVGQEVSKGDPIAKVFDLRHVEAEIIVSEKDIADVQVGQPVEIKARAYPARTFYGTVNSIAPVTNDANGLRADKTIIVRANLDNSGLALKIGMSGEAKVIGDKRRIFDLLVRKIYHFFRVEFWSWW